MNLRHLFKLQGILKLASILTALIAIGIGSSAYVNSHYNKTCYDSSHTLPPPIETTGDPEAGSDLTGSTSTTLRWRTTTTITLSPNQETLSTTPSPTTSSTTAPPTSTENDEDKDMAPVLWMELFHIGASSLAFIVSVILLIIFIVSEGSETSKVIKASNFCYHFVFGIVLIVASVFMGYAAIEIDRQICQVHQFEKDGECQKYLQKMIAAGFSLLTAIFYLVLSYVVVSTKLYEEV